MWPAIRCVRGAVVQALASPFSLHATLSQIGLTRCAVQAQRGQRRRGRGAGAARRAHGAGPHGRARARGRGGRRAGRAAAGARARPLRRVCGAAVAHAQGALAPVTRLSRMLKACLPLLRAAVAHAQGATPCAPLRASAATSVLRSRACSHGAGASPPGCRWRSGCWRWSWRPRCCRRCRARTPPRRPSRPAPRPARRAGCGRPGVGARALPARPAHWERHSASFALHAHAPTRTPVTSQHVLDEGRTARPPEEAQGWPPVLTLLSTQAPSATPSATAMRGAPPADPATHPGGDAAGLALAGANTAGLGPGAPRGAPWGTVCLAVLVQRSSDKAASVRAKVRPAKHVLRRPAEAHHRSLRRSACC